MTRKLSADEKNHGRSVKADRDASLQTRAEGEALLAKGYPRLARELQAEHTPVNFLRISMGRSGDYYAALGVWDTADSPLVMFGSGRTVLDALWALERALAGGHWKEDTWEQKKMVGTSLG